jgi:hypothetical protein
MPFDQASSTRSGSSRPSFAPTRFPPRPKARLRHIGAKLGSGMANRSKKKEARAGHYWQRANKEPAGAMAGHQGEAGAIVAPLRMAGESVAFYVQGDLDSRSSPVQYERRPYCLAWQGRHFDPAE